MVSRAEWLPQERRTPCLLRAFADVSALFPVMMMTGTSDPSRRSFCCRSMPDMPANLHVHDETEPLRDPTPTR